jgi:microsomal dipeptidase-like Zn-dependent dipeptidase
MKMFPRTIKYSIFFILLLFVLYGLMRIIVPPMIEKSLNQHFPIEVSELSAEAGALHSSLTIMDWHTDSLLWQRNILDRSDYGHVDVPRLQDSNFSFMMFTVVTKSPEGQNYESNTGDSDNITSLAMVQGWPLDAWDSLFARAMYQAAKLETAISDSDGALEWVRNKRELAAILKDQQAEIPKPIGALLGLEGSHALDGDLANIDLLYNAGYRMLGITHFFDNRLAGSLHGTTKSGLTPFGKAAITRFDELEIITDLAHVSEKAAWEILAQSSRPPVVSHTGFKGYCESQRNYPDDLMQAIAKKGGLIAVGYWEEAICDPTPAGIAGAIAYGIDLVGADHVALGSDWDGSITGIPANLLPYITEALINKGIAEADIRKVMGENSVSFLTRWLPD